MSNLRDREAREFIFTAQVKFIALFCSHRITRLSGYSSYCLCQPMFLTFANGIKTCNAAANEAVSIETESCIAPQFRARLLRVLTGFWYRREGQKNQLRISWIIR